VIRKLLIILLDKRSDWESPGLPISDAKSAAVEHGGFVMLTSLCANNGDGNVGSAWASMQDAEKSFGTNQIRFSFLFANGQCLLSSTIPGD
jgi:hypothetical protein